MAFLKMARAVVQNPHVTRSEWGKVRAAGATSGGLPLLAQSRVAAKVPAGLAPANLVEQANVIFGLPFNPDQYLLTHATIVASVDVYQPVGVKTGSVLEDGFRVNRKYGDFRIRPECQKFVNNNKDAWSRGVLLKSFSTFIGGHNYVEHVQIESLSKGRIIDAVARDIGDSVYIDLLIATDRKHVELIEAIQSGKMGTMSMGCQVDGTICTKCGHWAADETEMCTHIKYQKGNTFFDENGRQQVIAELCGHENLDPTGGVTFIEASWVETPAFTGAVLRNVMEMTDGLAERAASVLNTPPAKWKAGGQVKAATKAAFWPHWVTQSTRTNTERFGGNLSEDISGVDLKELAASQNPRVVANVKSGPLTNSSVLKVRAAGFISEDRLMALGGEGFLAGWADDEEAGEPEAEAEAEAEAPKEQADPLDSVKNDLKDHLTQQVTKQIKDEMKGKDVSDALDATAPNDSVQHEAALYAAALNGLVRTASSDVAFLNELAVFNKAAGVEISVPMYRAALRLGASTQYASQKHFVRACHAALGRQPSSSEIRVMAHLSVLLSRRAGNNVAVAKGA